ncbi:MAG: hypothetical protein J6C96_11830 [Oscillospiraceae bacterium]|nr:hypothetical protein [Oscillospiraceae bacterium]
MTDTEFLSRLPEGARKPTDKEFETIQFVYNYHPSIHPVEGKNQIAMPYSTFGMRVILDMRETAKRLQEIEDETRVCKLRLQELQKEADELAMK